MELDHLDHLSKMRQTVKEKKLRMTDLAKIFDKAESTINNYLNGKNDMPLQFYIDFCNYFKVPYSWYLEQTQEINQLKASLDNSMTENLLRMEISELKDKIIDLFESQSSKIFSLPSKVG